MKSAERELIEIERKRQANENKEATAAAKNASEVTRQKIKEITKQIEEETKKLALARSQIKKLKSTSTTTKSATKEKADDSGAATTSSKGKAAAAAASADDDAGEGEGKKSGGNSRGSTSTPLPESLYPELCRLVVSAGSDGMAKVVERFHAIHSAYPKRQIEIAIDKLLYKDKREGDTMKVWYVRSEYEHFLSPTTSTPAPAPAVKAESSKKRPREEVDAASPDANTVVTPGKAPKEPRKFKRAFGFFVKDKRSEAEAKLGADAEVR